MQIKYLFLLILFSINSALYSQTNQDEGQKRFEKAKNVFKDYKISLTTESEFLSYGWLDSNVFVIGFGPISFISDSINTLITIGYCESCMINPDEGIPNPMSMVEFYKNFGAKNINLKVSADANIKRLCAFKFEKGILFSVDWY